MKTASVSLLLLGVCVVLLSALTVSAVCLRVSPNLQQFFKGDSYVFLSCVDGWTVKRTSGGHTEDCGAAADFRRVNSSFCALDLSVSSGGNFLCENSSGQKRDEVSIVVSDKDLILEIPALPVRTGSDVTLRCKTGNGSVQKSYFFRDGVRLRSEPEEELILLNAQKSAEGLYSCSTAIDQSPWSRLRTRDSPLTTTTCSPPPSTFGNTGPPSFSPHPSLPTNSSSSPPRVSALRLFCHLLVFCPYCISTILLLMICWSRNPGTD